MPPVPPSAPPAKRVEKLLTARRAVISLLLAGCLAMLVYAFTISKDEAVPAVRDSAIVRVFPDDGDINLRQDAIGVELAFGYTGSIRLDRVEIPDDQLDTIPGINRISYTPGAGKEIPALSPGRHCATATFWRDSESRERGRTYTWCFTAA
jgi:hypothetical protein